MESEGSEDRRVCLGCFRGEMPNDKIKSLIKHQLEIESDNDADLTFVDKVMDKAAAKVTETFRMPLSPSEGGNSFTLSLTYGSAFPENQTKASKPPPSSGYFEFFNKSSTFCCIKVLKKGVNTKFEIPRPSYKAGELHD
jgi:hypothetical protein